MYNYPNYETERVAKYILHNNFFMNSLNLVIQDCLNSSVTKEYMAKQYPKGEYVQVNDEVPYLETDYDLRRCLRPEH